MNKYLSSILILSIAIHLKESTLSIDSVTLKCNYNVIFNRYEGSFNRLQKCTNAR